MSPTSVSAEHPAPAAARPWILQARGLAGQRGDRALFAHLEMALAPGTVTWLRGRNGRGKTSLLRLLAGLATPTAGEVSLAGMTLRQSGPEGRRRLPRSPIDCRCLRRFTI